MVLIVIAFMILLTVFYISLPLFRPRNSISVADSAVDGEGPDEADDLHVRKESLLSAIKEIDFDYKTGKLSEDDYRELQDAYRMKAISVIEEIDRRKDDTHLLEEKLEEEIRVSRGKASGQGVYNSGRTKINCPSCSGHVGVKDRFCQNCGESLQLICQACGHALEKSEKYCPGCGKSVRTITG